MKNALKIGLRILILLAPCAALPHAPDFQFVALHLWAADQPTEVGKELEAAFVYQGKIYWGYGDYLVNTGPITIVTLNPQDNSLAMEYTAETEAIHTFRVLSNGKLYVPHIDPTIGSGDPEYSRKDSARWISLNPVNSVHIFDIIDYQGRVYISGAGDDNAVVWVSSNAEGSFTMSLSADPKDESFSRFYFIGQLNGRLYVQAHDFVSGKHPSSKVFDGATWTNGPDLLPAGGTGYRPVTFASKMVYLQWRRPYPSGGAIYAFDGTAANIVSPFTDVAGYTVYGRELFVARRNGTITKTSDLLHWITVSAFNFPAQPRSIVVANGRIYLGLANAQIYRSTFSLPLSLPTAPGPAAIKG